MDQDLVGTELRIKLFYMLADLGIMSARESISPLWGALNSAQIKRILGIY